MKMNKLFSMLAGAALLVSCGGGGVSEEFKKELAAFETEWTEAGKAADAFGASLAEQDSMCKMDMANMTVPDSIKANATPEALASIDSLAAICMTQSSSMDEIKTTFDGFKAGWDKDSKDWADWKAKVEKGEVKEDEAKKKMEDWRKKLADAKTNIGDWTAALDATRSECSATCKAHMDMVAAIPATPAKPAKKGK
jgi:hypothetical protein